MEAEYAEDGHHHRYSAPVINVDWKTDDLKQIRKVLVLVYLNNHSISQNYQISYYLIEFIGQSAYTATNTIYN